MRMPALFIGHGNPMNAIERNEFHLGWSAVATRLPRPRSILCVSAHWETQGAWVTAAAKPATIHDFYGFPKALFDVRYPAPGDPALAARVASLVASERVGLDPERGLDHGAWSVLIAMYPEADVPVVQLGMDTRLPGAHHYALARQLAALRDEGVLVLGSGGFVHNLGDLDWQHADAPLAPWAGEFAAWMHDRLAAQDWPGLLAWQELAPHARHAHPTVEHLMPLFVALGAAGPAPQTEVLHRSHELGTLALDAFAFH